MRLTKKNENRSAGRASSPDEVIPAVVTALALTEEGEVISRAAQPECVEHARKLLAAHVAATGRLTATEAELRELDGDLYARWLADRRAEERTAQAAKAYIHAFFPSGGITLRDGEYALAAGTSLPTLVRGNTELSAALARQIMIEVGGVDGNPPVLPALDLNVYAKAHSRGAIPPRLHRLLLKEDIVRWAHKSPAVRFTRKSTPDLSSGDK